MSKNEKYGGILDGIVDNILEKYGIDEKTVKKVAEISSSLADNVTTQSLGGETFITIHLDKIHFKFKKD